MSQPPHKTGERSPAKREQILGGARAAFTELGFERASVDLIAARAGVSKATVYGHFQDKQALFFASFLEVAELLRERVSRALAAPTGEVEQDLRRVGEHFLEVVLAPTSIALHRIMVAEVARFPKLGQALFQHVACTMTASMAGYLRRLHEAGSLRVEDAELASKQFLALCQVDLAVQCQLGIKKRASGSEIQATVRSAVATFLRAHRP